MAPVRSNAPKIFSEVLWTGNSLGLGRMPEYLNEAWHRRGIGLHDHLANNRAIRRRRLDVERGSNWSARAITDRRQVIAAVDGLYFINDFGGRCRRTANLRQICAGLLQIMILLRRSFSSYRPERTSIREQFL